VHPTKKDKQALTQLGTLRVTVVIVFRTATGNQTVTHAASLTLKAPHA
jgi:hypothetical protein